eukprot:5873815-Amphidinium_carterae.1
MHLPRHSMSCDVMPGYGNSAEGSETNYACTRRNLTHPSNFSVAAYGWHGSQAARARCMMPFRLLKSRGRRQGVNQRAYRQPL